MLDMDTWKSVLTLILSANSGTTAEGALCPLG